MWKKQVKIFDFVIGAAVLLWASCSSEPPAQNSQADQQEAAASVTALQFSQRPLWIQQTPESAEFLYFTGMAEASGESEARTAAVRNGFAAAAGFYGNLIQSETADHSIFMEDMRRTIADATIYDDKTNSYTNAVISEVQAVEYYTETYRAPSTRVSYKVWALCRVSRQRAEEDRANFAKNISDKYVPLIDTPYDTLSAGLHAYSAVLTALDQNPLHRAVAYYDGPGGKVGMYEYCGIRLHDLAGTVSFDALPAAAVQRGRNFTGTIRISSGTFTEIGVVSCRIVITGKNNGVPPAEYSLGRDNTFTLEIPTARLEAGTYTVGLELLLNAAAPALRQNPKGSFSLEVRSASAEIRFGGETLSGAEQRMFSQAVQAALQEHRVPLLAGYEFLVTFNIRPQTEPVAGTRVLICDISISLNSAGSVLFQSAPARITEISRDQAIKLASDHIRGDRAFWTGAARLTQREE